MTPNAARAQALTLAVETLCNFGSVRVPDVLKLADEYAGFILGGPGLLPPTTPITMTDANGDLHTVDDTDLGPGGVWGPPCYDCGHVQGSHLDVTRRGCDFGADRLEPCQCPRFQTAPVPAPEPETPRAGCSCHRHSHRSVSPNSMCITTGCFCRVLP